MSLKRNFRKSILKIKLLLASGSGRYTYRKFPKELGNLHSLIQLSISSNQLLREVPVQIALLPELTILELSTNNLSGFISEQFGTIWLLDLQSRI
jgi:Leucine-rich repeat (LRR) protein